MCISSLLYLLKKLKCELKSIKRLIRQGSEIAEFVFCKLFWERSGKEPAGVIVLIHNSSLADFNSSLPFFERLKNQCKYPLVLVGDSGISELVAASGIFDGFTGVDFKRINSHKHWLCRWKTLMKLRELSAVKAVQCFTPGKTGFEDCMLLAVKSPEKYVFVDNFHNVQRSGTFYEALRVKFFDKALPYRLELSLSENENNYATFITGKMPER